MTHEDFVNAHYWSIVTINVAYKPGIKKYNIKNERLMYICDQLYIDMKIAWIVTALQ
jgi:hypothetical protein